MSAATRRLVWLDILRLLAAVEIVGYHWLRAVVKLGALAAGQPDNFVISYRQLSLGLGGLGNALLSHSPHPTARLVNDAIGLLFEFGWQAVHLFVLLSGFSLALALGRRSADPAWGRWLLRRAERILTPFYIISLPLVVVMLTLPYLARGPLLRQFVKKLLQNQDGSAAHTLFAQIFLFDPWRHLFVPLFLSPAWWFVPAILVGYLVFPLIWMAFRHYSPGLVLAVALAVSLGSYTAILHGHALEWGWYFVAFNEAFNFCLGILLGRLYTTASGKERIEAHLRSTRTLLLGIALLLAGNLCNLYQLTYPVSSSVFTLGLAICGGQLAVRLQSSPLVAKLLSIDPYILYLLHQSFAFPVAVLLLRRHAPAPVALGLVLYFAITLPLAWAVTRLVAGLDDWGARRSQPELASLSQ